MFQLSSYVCNSAGLTGNKFHSNIKRGRKKIEGYNGKEKVPRKSDKMPAY